MKEALCTVLLPLKAQFIALVYRIERKILQQAEMGNGLCNPNSKVAWNSLVLPKINIDTVCLPAGQSDPEDQQIQIYSDNHFYL